MDPLLLFLIFGAVIIALAIYSSIQARKRREGLAELARHLRLDFNPRASYALADDYFFLDRLDQGSNRYAFNILWNSEIVRAFGLIFRDFIRQFIPIIGSGRKMFGQRLSDLLNRGDDGISEVPLL